MTTLRNTAALAALAAILAGCGFLPGQSGIGTRVTSQQPLPFATSLRTGEDTRDMLITVAAGGASLDAVRESARYAATVHCMQNYGYSDTEWERDAATGDWAHTRDSEGNLIVRGRCTAIW